MSDVLAAFAFALVATVIVEAGLAAILFGVRSPRDLVVVALAQAVTNPVVELVCMSVAWSVFSPFPSIAWAAMLVAEAAAVAVEALIYRSAAVFEHPLAASALLNATSFAIGCVIGLIA